MATTTRPRAYRDLQGNAWEWDDERHCFVMEATGPMTILEERDEAARQHLEEFRAEFAEYRKRYGLAEATPTTTPKASSPPVRVACTIEPDELGAGGGSAAKPGP